ncbi:MAG: hypothetical protein V1792_06395 [Pseudomonadota bacterium]
MKLTAFLIVFLLLIASSAVQADDATRQESAEPLECDRRCAASVGKAYIVLKRLGNEVVDLNYVFDENFVSSLVKFKGLGYLVGPYYGWRGCDKKCGVLVRLSKHEGKWVIEGSALKGSEPEPGARHVYGMYVTSGKDIPATVKRNIVDAKNGDPLEWNTYPLGDFATGQCHIESIIGTGGLEQPVLGIPKAVPCGKIQDK